MIEMSREEISREIAWDYDMFMWDYNFNDKKELKVPTKVLTLIQELVSRYIDREELGKYYRCFTNGFKEISVKYLMIEIEKTLYTKTPFNYEDFDLIDGNFIFLVAKFVDDNMIYINSNFEEIERMVTRDNKIDELINS